MKFGRRQFNRPTPSSVNNFVQIFTVLGAVFLSWMGTSNFIPVHLSTVLQSILGLLIGLANGIKPFIGVSDTGKKSVPIEDVTAMDEKKP